MGQKFSWFLCHRHVILRRLIANWPRKFRSRGRRLLLRWDVILLFASPIFLLFYFLWFPAGSHSFLPYNHPHKTKHQVQNQPGESKPSLSLTTFPQTINSVSSPPNHNINTTPRLPWHLPPLLYSQHIHTTYNSWLSNESIKNSPISEG